MEASELKIIKKLEEENVHAKKALKSIFYRILSELLRNGWDRSWVHIRLIYNYLYS
jgi:hypothetical protein